MSGTILKIEAAIRDCPQVPQESAEALAHDRGLKRLEAICPRCGHADVVCCHAEVGGSLDFRDQYLHVCLTVGCGYFKYNEQTSDVGHESLDDQLCPFCGRDVVTEAVGAIIPRHS